MFAVIFARLHNSSVVIATTADGFHEVFKTMVEATNKVEAKLTKMCIIMFLN